MKPLKATKKSDYESYLEVDLEDLFGAPVPNNSSFRQAVGQAIIDTIVERTENKKYLNNSTAKYSDSYVESTDFEIFGKSKGRANLTQSGDMLGTLDIIEEDESVIKIGWDNPDIAARATNHNFGIGKGIPEREFLGLSEKEIAKIKEEFSQDISTFSNSEITTSSVDRLRDFVLGIEGPRARTADNIFRSLFGETQEDDL